MLFVSSSLSPILLFLIRAFLFVLLRVACRLIQACWHSGLCSRDLRHLVLSVLLLLFFDSFSHGALLLLLGDTLVEMCMGSLKLFLPELKFHFLGDAWYPSSLDLRSLWKTLEEFVIVTYLVNALQHLLLDLGPDVILVEHVVRRVYMLEQHQLEISVWWHVHYPTSELANGLSLLMRHFLRVGIVSMVVGGLAVELCKHLFCRWAYARIPTTVCTFWQPHLLLPNHFEELKSDEWVLERR